MEGVMKKAIAKAVARRVTEDEFDTVALWSTVLWAATLLYLLATFDPIH
jgi:hypothetical protein